MRFRLNGWHRLGVIASCIWLLATLALIILQFHFGAGTVIQLVETVVAKTGAAPTVLVGRSLLFAIFPVIAGWVIVYLCVWAARWVARGFKKTSTNISDNADHL